MNRAFLKGFLAKLAEEEERDPEGLYGALLRAMRRAGHHADPKVIRGFRRLAYNVPPVRPDSM